MCRVVSAPVPPLWGPVPNDGVDPRRIGVSERVEERPDPQST